MNHVYVLESRPDSDEHSSIDGVFTTREAARVYAERMAGQSLEWHTGQPGNDPDHSLAHAIRDGVYPDTGEFFRYVDGYYITRRTLNPTYLED
ncbi:hypothetical protein [Nocardia flavorosea]|uniref:Uncharacterized protein n=1 Tax=Nocardia flavorosea TaxID=53429 RepID=A0A846YSJ0_9NOCA|nr:hypothetical protein [Nocardia flavorosea]NKY60408.1 hypothetical protein [Nocardia flavorosea]